MSVKQPRNVRFLDDKGQITQEWLRYLDSLANAAATAAATGSKIVKNWRSDDAAFPASNYAGVAVRNAHPVLTYDTTTPETAYFYGVVPDNYASEGFTFEVWYCAATATSGTIGWTVAFETLDGQDIDSSGFASAQTITAATVPASAGQVTSGTVDFTNAQIDGLVAGDAFRISLTRNTSADNASGDAQVLQCELRIL